MQAVAKVVVGMKVNDALSQMKFYNKRRAKVIHDTLVTAANMADVYHNLQPEDLYVAEALVGKGKYMKRVRFRGRGRVNIIRKPTCHLTLVVREDTRQSAKVKRGFGRHNKNYQEQMLKFNPEVFVE